MMHGPCGSDNKNCSCMKAGVCTKGFPKPFNEEIKLDSQGFPLYKRPDNGRYVRKGNVNLDNRYVVPHNLALLKKYEAHINVVFCNKGHLVKFLFKYVT